MKQLLKNGALHRMVVISIAVCCILLAVFLLSIPKLYSIQIWNNYLLLLADNDSVGSTEDLLTEIGLSFYSRNTSSVYINDYFYLKEIPLSSVDEEMPPGDPRMDPYIKKALQFFEGTFDGENCSIIYLETDNWSVSFRWKLLRFLMASSRDLVFNEMPVKSSMIIIAALSLFIVIRIIVDRKCMVFKIMQILPLLMFVYPFVQWKIVIVLSLYFYFAIIADISDKYIKRIINHGSVDRGFYSRNEIILLSTVLFVGITGGIMISGGLSVQESPQIVTFLFLEFGMLFSHIIFRIRKYRSWAYRSFTYIPLKPDYVIQPSSSENILAVCFFGIILLTGVIDPGAHDLELLTIPIPETGSTLSEVSESSPLAVEDYIAHRAYQQFFPYAYPYSVPAVGDTVTISEFENVDGVVKRNEKKIQEFTEEWYNSIISQEDERGVLDILLSQIPPVAVKTDNYYENINYRGINTIDFKYRILIALTFLVFVNRLFPVLIWRTREIKARRNQQIA